MKRMLIHIEEEQYETLRWLAFERKSNMSEIVREALNQYLRGEREMKKLISVQDQLGAEIFVDDFGREYFVTDAPEMYTWEPKDRKKVMEWLNSPTQKGVAPDFPEFIKDYEYETVVIDDQEFDYEAVVNLMDDDIREELHQELTPCSAQEFVDTYIKRHKEKFNEEFVIN